MRSTARPRSTLFNTIAASYSWAPPVRQNHSHVTQHAYASTPLLGALDLLTSGKIASRFLFRCASTCAFRTLKQNTGSACCNGIAYALRQLVSPFHHLCSCQHQDAGRQSHLRLLLAGREHRHPGRGCNDCSCSVKWSPLSPVTSAVSNGPLRLASGTPVTATPHPRDSAQAWETGMGIWV